MEDRLMDFFRFGLNDYQLAVLAFLMLVLPAAFYIMGLMEGRAGRALFSCGLALHGLSILHRGLLLSRLPLTEKHDNVSLVAFAMALLYSRLSRRREGSGLAWTALPLICLVCMAASKFRPINTVSPFMQSPWFYAHSFFYFLSCAYFGLAACLGAEYAVSGRAGSEALQYRMLSQGWILFSVSLFAGSVWFYMAYGSYWLWTSKEMWISITWLYAGLCLHARLMRGLRGTPAVVMGVLVFGVAVFTYLGVGTVIPSPPTQF